MKTFIFYTPEGYTFPPDENKEVDNCQLLGIASGKDLNEATNNLLNENPWILKVGFTINKIISKRIVE
ncbi:MAG: hypothetical protein PHD11_02900 [Bacteroidales bacterium]|nr:hypothetical protein [Bacteroidales bacterium]MDD4669455.1 hypothetical protein [Bacteroidales bacterium]